MSTLYETIPVLDLNDFTCGEARKKDGFVKALGAAFQQIGFVALKNHGLSEALCEDLYKAVQDFFLQPDTLKAKYEIKGLFGQRGYTGKGKEHAKGRTTGDLKEFYHIGQEMPPNDKLASEYLVNVWPEEIQEFKKCTIEAFQILENAGKSVLQAIALFLELDEHYFDEKVVGGNSILRPIHYFLIENPELVPYDAVRAAEHGDINLITLLMGASADGLQVLRRDNQWIPITALPDQIVVNVGDMLERLTNKQLKSTIHRVVNPPKEKMKSSRFSIPFFMHPRSDMSLACLQSCIDVANPKQFDDMTAGEFLNERLVELGLKK